ncbi:MAG: hypothetical protein U0232_02325 [Thermomicrobiales bacterium]
MTIDPHPYTPEKQYPRAYFAAPVHFACRIAILSGLPIIAAIETYTGLYREIVNAPPSEGCSHPLWADLTREIAPLSDPEAITGAAYARYCAQPHSAYDPHKNGENARIFGALGYYYHAEMRQVRLHFFPARSATSALARQHLPQRRADFAQLLADVRQFHPEAATVKSSTWLQNLPNYRTLFPAAFTARLRDIGGGSYLGVWGQFVRADGSDNHARLADFQSRLATARILTEAINALPLKVLEATGPIADFYPEYNI